MLKFYCLFFIFSFSVFAHTPYLEKTIYTLPIIDKIPKIIHQIWVGKNPIPEKYKEYMKTWQIIHPDWEYKLWTDEDVDDFPWRNKDLFLQAENPGMKSDIWRYEIINQYGGLYVDTDMEAIRSFEAIHSRLEFYAGLGGRRLIINSVFASKPNSPILNKIIEGLKESVHCQSYDSFNFITVLHATGPYFFTKMINMVLPTVNPSLNIIFPQPYFQPTECNHSGFPKTKRELYNIRNVCLAIHYNGCSWLPEKFESSIPGK